MAFIQNIGLAKAPFQHKQEDILEFMLETVDVPEGDIDKVKRLYDRSEISSRYSAIEDFSLDPKQRALFKGTKVSTAERMKAFFENAPDMCLSAVKACSAPLEKITHLITVSCTGLAAPGLEILLSEQLGLKSTVHRTAINFMGCYAGFQALKTAQGICAVNTHAQVLIVDVELCTLHFQNEFSYDNIASSLLFADGAAAVWINNEQGQFKIEHFHAALASNSKKDMTWNLGESGFLMTLSAYVPDIIAENIEALLEEAIQSSGYDRKDISYWAIHPGGKKILNEVAKALELKSNDLDISRRVLDQFGNMSSATIFFVLDEIANNCCKENDKVFAAGFGPGLSMESLVLNVCPT